MAAPTSGARFRVYCALRDGHSHSGAAALLGLARPTVEHHAGQLLAAGRLMRDDKQHGKPAKYRRGPRAMLYEAEHKAQKGDHEGRTSPVCVPDGARVHRGEFKVRVAPYGAHRAEPTVDKEWTANGVRFREWWHTADGGNRVRVRECKGVHNCSLILQPEEQRTNGPAETDAVEVLWARRVDETLRELEMVYGYARVARIERSTPVEYEWEAPALQPGVRARAKDGDVWTDASMGPASLETDSRAVAVAVAGLPEHLVADAQQKRDLAARLDALQRQADRFGPVVRQDLLEPIVRVLEKHGGALTGILGDTQEVA